jgi:type IV pilus assembly protein PilA
VKQAHAGTHSNGTRVKPRHEYEELPEEANARAVGNKGFTLIELLVVVAIIAILAAIAIPQFAMYRQKGFDSQAKSDLRNIAVFEEAYFSSNQVYLACSGTGAASTCNDPKIGGTLPGGTISRATTIAVVLDGADPNHFTATSTSTKGTGITCSWDNQQGGFLGCS